MSADAASLPCPICLHSGVFHSAQALKDRLIYVSTNNILCPICQESITGLDKLTIHLFSHVQFMPRGTSENAESTKPKYETKHGNQISHGTQQKKTKTTTAKNKATSPTSPVKFVKICPKPPLIALNTMPVIDISKKSTEESIQTNNSEYIPTLKTKAAPIKSAIKCAVCGVNFHNSDILKMHQCLIHNDDEKCDKQITSFNCHLCSKYFKMRGSLMVHLRVAHYGFSSDNAANKADDCHEINEKNKPEDNFVSTERSDGKQWQCDVCRKSFTTKYFLKKHKRLHTGETPYACTQCNKTFTFQQSYHKHLLYHNDDKPHTCNYCGRAFKELSTLHNHQRIHTGEKPFSCETCGKSFRQRVSYLVHRRIHTGVMPYKCTACEKSFRYKVSQRTHKCQAQPPGTVVRQTGDLVEKLKKKCVDSGNAVSKRQDPNCFNMGYLEVSEANAELVRSGAKISLEDIESDCFSIIADVFENNQSNKRDPSSIISEHTLNDNCTDFNKHDTLDANIEDLIDSTPISEKNLPSPSDILKNLYLTSDDTYI